jgi:ABC-type antimicrobial peptide transport system permease subunit
LNVGYINYIRPANNNDDDTIPIPVAAVVEQLPDYLNGIVNEKLLISMKGGFNDNPLDISSHNTELCFFINAEVNSEEMLKTIQNKFPDKQIKDLVNESHAQGKRFVLYTDYPVEDFETIKALLKNHEVIRVYNFSDKPLPPAIESDRPDFITIPFNSLDSVSAFQKYLEENHNNVRIDMNTVEAKNNFNTFDKISNLLGLLLTVFGSVLMISITLNTILNHIEKNKTNLGTLKAFGMSNLSVTIVYTGIAAFLIFSITAIGFVFNKITGSIISNYVAKLGNMNISQEYNLYVLEFNTTLLLIFVLFPILTVFGFIYHKLYNKTPGDLIYDRD